MKLLRAVAFPKTECELSRQLYSSLGLFRFLTALKNPIKRLGRGQVLGRTFYRKRKHDSIINQEAVDRRIDRVTNNLQKYAWLVVFIHNW